MQWKRVHNSPLPSTQAASSGSFACGSFLDSCFTCDQWCAQFEGLGLTIVAEDVLRAASRRMTACNAFCSACCLLRSSAASSGARSADTAGACCAWAAADSRFLLPCTRRWHVNFGA